MKYTLKEKVILMCLCGCLCMSLVSCHATYHKDKVIDSIKEICFEEYGIENVEVKIVGRTIGVYLPLDQLFSVDYTKFLKGEAVGDLENLVQFHPEALSKVEDVLFSTSRVILSTDRDIDFYLLNATDTKITGIQFTILGNVLDMKRVRLWDISRSEYRKRLIHDLSINKTVLWKKNVISFFEELPKLPLEEIIESYCASKETFIQNSPHFYKQLEEKSAKKNLFYEILDIRGKPYKANDIIVYAKIKENYTQIDSDEKVKFLFENGFVGEYIFILSMIGMEYKIVQVIPFHYIDQDGVVRDIEFPDQLRIYKNIDNWPQDFDFEEVRLEDFIAEQTSKRLQALFATDQRILSAFTSKKQSKRVLCSYELSVQNKEGRIEVEAIGIYKFFISMRFRDKLFMKIDDFRNNEDLQYAVDLLLKEFMTVVSAYAFKDFEYVEIQIPLAEEKLVFSRKLLEKFRENKLAIDELIEQASREISDGAL